MKPIYTCGRSLFRLIFSTYFGWNVEHPERVPAAGPVILAANHTSYLDPPLIGAAALREINYLARASLFRFPVMGWLLRRVNSVPVDRDGGSGKGLRTIMGRLEQGGAIILFPEGTRSTDGNLMPAESGIGLIVLKTRAPVVPVRVFGTHAAYGRGMKFPMPRRRVGVSFGEPITFDAERAEAATAPRPRLKELYLQSANQIMAEIARIGPPARA